MANSLGNYGERLALDAAAGVAPAKNLYLALFTTAPDATGAGTEVSPTGTNYSRKQATFDAAATDGGGVTSTSNSAPVEFDPATASWGTIVGIGIFDSATHGAGNLHWYGTVTNPKAVGVGDILKFAIGAIDLKMD